MRTTGVTGAKISSRTKISSMETREPLISTVSLFHIVSLHHAHSYKHDSSSPLLSLSLSLILWIASTAMAEVRR
jgi:hypothetical protein